MKALDAVHEFRLVNALVAGFARSPRQRNLPHGADAELVELPGGSTLAVTIDGLSEEYALGLLRDPFALGWSVVAHSLSDLAAVAAEPLGVMLSYALPEDQGQDFGVRLSEGAAAALDAHGTYCLGGDTSFAREASFQCCALGLVADGPLLTRRGAVAGDALWTTGPAGGGNLVGIAGRVSPELWARAQDGYRPRARLAAARRVRELVHAAIDTSDGMLPAVHVLAAANGCGAAVDLAPAGLHPGLLELAGQAGFPTWFAGAFGMGDYELLLAVPPENEAAVEEALRAEDLAPWRVGELTAAGGMTLVVDGAPRPLDGARLLNLFAEAGSLDAYVEGLGRLDAEMRGASP